MQGERLPHSHKEGEEQKRGMHSISIGKILVVLAILFAVGSFIHSQFRLLRLANSDLKKEVQFLQKKANNLESRLNLPFMKRQSPEASPVVLRFLEKPELLKEVPLELPEYTGIRIYGIIVLEVEVDIEGRVRNTWLIQGHPLVNMQAINAVRQYEYEPYTVSGSPRPAIFTEIVQFRIGEGWARTVTNGTAR